MNTSRATVGISAIILAAAISLAGGPREADKVASVKDPSVPSASEAFNYPDNYRKASEGNVQDLTY
jgi:hypothetical protein